LKSKFIAVIFIFVIVVLRGETISNTLNAYTWSAPAGVTSVPGTAMPSTVTAAVEETPTAQSDPSREKMPEDICGGLLYAGVNMWTGYSVRTKKDGLEVIIGQEELKKMLVSDDEGKKYYDDSEMKKVFATSFELAAAASVIYFLIESRFFDSGNINSGRPAVLIATGAAIPLFLMGANWAGNEAFNDINRSMNVYNSNISCGLKK
jgi:hypothetical protein